MRINITLEKSTDFEFKIDNRTKTELYVEESTRIWQKQTKSLSGVYDLIWWIMENNDFNQCCRFYKKGGEAKSQESFYLEIIRWLKMQNLTNHPLMQYVLIPVFDGENLVEFIGLFAKCQLQHNRKRLTCYRFGEATVEPVTDKTKNMILCSLSVKSSDFMQKHERLCSKGVRPEEVIKSQRKSISVLTSYRKFDTMRVSKRTLTS